MVIGSCGGTSRELISIFYDLLSKGEKRNRYSSLSGKNTSILNRTNRVANRNPVLSSQSPFGAKFPDRYNTYKQGNFPIAPQNKPTIATANGRKFIALNGPLMNDSYT
jgi:hypothetical protein